MVHHTRAAAASDSELSSHLVPVTRKPFAFRAALVGLAVFAGAEASRWCWGAGQGYPTFWAPVGLYLAVLLLARRQRWPVLILVVGGGSLVSDCLFHHASLMEALAFFGAYTLAAVVGALILRPSEEISFRLESLRSVWHFVGGTGAACAAISAPLGAGLVAHFWPASFLPAYTHWFLASLAGIWLTTPLVLACAYLQWKPVREWRWARIVEAALLFGTLLPTSFSMFAGGLSYVSLPSLLLMWAIWAVLRFGAPGSGLAMMVIGVTAMLATVEGKGPFIRPDRSVADSIIRLLVYLGVWSGFLQIVAALLAEHTRALAALASLNRDLELRVAERTASLTRAGEDLRVSENRLALAVKSGHSGTFDWDALSNQNVWSDDLLALYGLKREEFSGTIDDWFASIHPDDLSAARTALETTFRTGQFGLQFRIRRRDTGETRWLEGRGTLLRDEQGKPARLLGINVDVTEQRRIEEALRQSEQRLNFVLEAADVGVWSVDFETGQLTASTECRSNFGLGPEDDFSQHEHLLARIHPDDRAAEAAATAQARARHGEYDAEYRVRWPDGSLHWILARGLITLPETGHAGHLTGIALDITERKGAEDALRQSESKLRSYYEAAPLFMGLLELEGSDLRHLYDNPASSRFFGNRSTDTSGRLASALGASRENIELWRKNCILSAERRQPARFEVAHLVPAGQRWLSVTVTALPQSSGEQGRFAYIAEDVTSRRRTEASLRQHATRQAALLELTRTILSRRADAVSLAAAIFQRVSTVLEADLGFNYRLRPGASQLELVFAYGLTQEQSHHSCGLSLEDSFCGSVASSAAPLIADAARIGSDVRGEFLHSLGARAYACHPLLASDGRVLGTLSFGSTTRERFEPEEVSFLQTLCHYVAIAWERAAAEAAMVQAKESAEAANRAKDDFLAALSHELRTPLNPVLLLASELMHQGGLPPETLADLATIRRNVELEARLIDDLLDLTRITRGKVHLELRPVEVHQVLRESLEILEADMAARELDLHQDLAPLTPLVHADSVRLQQVFWNILRNAIKFTPMGGRVTVRTGLTASERAFVEVIDTGEGIPADHLNSIFETFNQGEGGHRFGGLGLGLAIARSIVGLHGGTITAHSSGPGGGSTFRVELPLLPQATLAGPHANGHTPLPPPAPPRTGLHILLVEDHEPTRSALQRLLSRRQHQVESADCLAAARRLAERQKFDLLISDLGLPDGDGAELMRQFSSAGGPPGIALSGYGMDEDLRRSNQAGFFAHLVKPVDVASLDRVIAAWAESQA